MLMAFVLTLVLPQASQWLQWTVVNRIAALLGFILLGAVLYIGALAILGVRRRDFVLQ